MCVYIYIYIYIIRRCPRAPAPGSGPAACCAPRKMFADLCFDAGHKYIKTGARQCCKLSCFVIYSTSELVSKIACLQAFQR